MKLTGLFNRSAAMGVLKGPVITRFDAPSVNRLVTSLQRHGIANQAAVTLEPLLSTVLQVGPKTKTTEQQLDQIARVIDQLEMALEVSATPTTEWAAMREVFGDEALADLLEISLTSLKRYGAEQRKTPAVVAERLHWLAMVVADLAGAYNDFGIRRWFKRPRAQLGGASPRDYLGREWNVDDKRTRRVRELASVLSGAQALAV